jgi:N-acetylglucosamine-6-phosphate deacetylase
MAADARTFLLDGVVLATGERTSIRIEGSRIAAIAPTAEAARRFDGEGLLAAPGFIELQINGAAGHDLTTEPESLWAVGAALGAYGVTSFLPTLVSPGFEVVDRALAAWRADPPPGWVGAEPLGWHVEGPFLSPTRAGAHHPESLRPPDVAAVTGWSPAAGVRIATLAPELPGALDLVTALVGNGVVVSAGHSAATYAQARAGFDAGIRGVTHLCNAMAPFDHREPGLIGAALEDPRVTVWLIPDGIHVHPAMVSIVRRAIGAERLAIVSDAIAALGMPDGSHQLAGREVDVSDGEARLADGVLAGSVLRLDEGLRNLVSFGGCTIAEALPAVTSVPARLLGIGPERGTLRPGAIADVTLLTPGGEVALTIAAGRVIHDATEGARWA